VRRKTRPSRKSAGGSTPAYCKTRYANAPTSSVRFHFDGYMPNAVVQVLRQREIDVLTVHKAGMLGRPDYELLAHAHAAGRVMVTHDADYLRLHSQDVEHAGIAYCAHGSRTIGQIVESLVLIHEVYEPDERTNRLEYL
jgi:hypothetical protein